MRIAVTLVIEMSDEQVQGYADEYGLPRKGGRLYAREVVEDVRSQVLTGIADSTAFGERGDGTRGADVSIKGA
jgi:hypothetical protein